MQAVNVGGALYGLQPLAYNESPIDDSDNVTRLVHFDDMVLAAIRLVRPTVHVPWLRTSTTEHHANRA